MNALATFPQVKKRIGLLPEIWYTILLGGMALDNVDYLTRTPWNSSSLLFLILYFGVVALLVRQFFRASGWVSVILGALFSIGSLFMFLAVLSEYKEFPLRTEPGAISLICVGSLLTITSFMLAARMFLKGCRIISTF